jgi:hypothetical protein
MKFLYLLLLFFWVSLLENTLGENAILFKIADGLEIRASLIIKTAFFFLNCICIYKQKKIDKSFVFIGIFLLFLLVSTCYTLLLNPSYFLSSFSQFVHFFLNFNIVFFVFLYLNNINQMFSFIKGLTYFAYFNAFLVVLSYFFPILFSGFEASTSDDGVTRSFGLMGDEVSLFLTFFLYAELVKKNRYGMFIFLAAIICTGSIGATITTVSLLFYHFFKNLKLSQSLIIKTALSVFLFLFFLIIFSSQLQQLSVVSRINQNLSGSEEGTGQLRVLSLLNGFEMFMKRPFFGVGYGSYNQNVMSTYSGLIESAGNVMSESTAGNILGSTYNPFLQIVCEAGLVGLTFFIYLIVNFLKLLKIKLETSPPLVQNFRQASYGWLLIFIITCLSANWFLPASFLLLLILTLVGLNLKLNNLYKQ